MFIPTVYTPGVDIKNNKIELSESKLHHIKNVLRIRENNEINISNGKGHIMFGKLKEDFVLIDNVKEFQKPNNIKVFIPFLREKNRFRYLIEKLVELNVSELHIGETHNTQKINIKSEKIDSWVVSAIEQSGSPFYPNIIYSEYVDFDLFDTCFDISGEQITNNKNITNFAIGPEGGWSKEELKNFKFKFMLTEFNLRSETAAITALSLTM
jgi:16S rRNA (uracil1498-N3)-methyltransferase